MSSKLIRTLLFAAIASFVLAAILLVITYFLYGIHIDPTTMTRSDHYCNYIIFFLCGASFAFTKSLRWVKNDK